jgi:serine phosphatase RsbU (regulator of sigma subunit)
VTIDFRQEFEAETRSLLRRRFLWFTGTVSLVGGFFLIASIVTALVLGWAKPGQPTEADVRTLLNIPLANWGGMGLGLLGIGAYFGCFMYVRRVGPPAAAILNLSFWLVVFDGVVHISMGIFKFHPDLGMWGVLITHLLACSFLPWTPVQAIRPLIPLLVLQGIKVFLIRRGEDQALQVSWALIVLAFSGLAGAPGVLICYLRQSRRLEEYKLNFLQRRYGEVRRELVDARRIHEALFPKPITEGPVRFRYLYEPMRQIGGDYLFACRSPSTDEHGGRLNIVLLDVTGHGIAAALTVNRLYGELQRVYAEDPDASPGEILALLNRYVHLTLATHSVFATALCVSVDPSKGVLRCASGGHPPAFIRASDGTLHELPSTAFVLGACADAEFEHGEVSARFGPGDCLIAYTDGAIEARGHDGRMLGIKGLQRLFASERVDASIGWPETVLRAVERYRDGPPADDTLVIEVVRPVGAGAGAGAVGTATLRADDAIPVQA